LPLRQPRQAVARKDIVSVLWRGEDLQKDELSVTDHWKIERLPIIHCVGYMGHLVTENRNGLVVESQLTLANGTAEREAATAMMERKPAGGA
jgi:hypothetical protein